jgi:hypothetical protein
MKKFNVTSHCATIYIYFVWTRRFIHFRSTLVRITTTCTHLKDHRSSSVKDHYQLVEQLNFVRLPTSLVVPSLRNHYTNTEMTQHFAAISQSFVLTHATIDPSVKQPITSYRHKTNKYMQYFFPHIINYQRISVS